MGVAISCSGVDPRPECHRAHDRSDWGVDTYVVGGHVVGAGGTWWCGTKDNVTSSGRWMDAGYYGRAATAFVKTEQQGEDVSACTTTLVVATGSHRVSQAAPCVVPPPHARDFVLP